MERDERNQKKSKVPEVWIQDGAQDYRQIYLPIGRPAQVLQLLPASGMQWNSRRASQWNGGIQSGRLGDKEDAAIGAPTSEHHLGQVERSSFSAQGNVSLARETYKVGTHRLHAKRRTHQRDQQNVRQNKK